MGVLKGVLGYRHADAPAGMAVFDTMRHIRPDVSTVCVGLAASMGAFLLASGHKVGLLTCYCGWERCDASGQFAFLLASGHNADLLKYHLARKRGHAVGAPKCSTCLSCCVNAAMLALLDHVAGLPASDFCPISRPLFNAPRMQGASQGELMSMWLATRASRV